MGKHWEHMSTDAAYHYIVPLSALSMEPMAWLKHTRCIYTWP